MFVRDLLKIGDLQLRLLSLDMRKAGKGVRTGLILVVVSVTVLLGAFPVILLGVAAALQSHCGLRQEVALLLAGTSGVALGGVILLAGVRILISASTPLKRSQQELAANLRWIRGVLYRES